MSGALAFAALALALGATDDEVSALWTRLAPEQIPSHPADAISDLRRALDEIKGFAFRIANLEGRVDD